MYLHERHIWYRLDLSDERSRIGLRTGFDLVRASLEELSVLEQLPTIGVFEAQKRLQQGAEFWLVRHGGRAAFCCWVFRSRIPVLAARGGWLELPAKTVGLEDAVALPGYRGRGIAPAALMKIAEILGQSGAAAAITKVEDENLSFRRALEKMGFRAIASMRLDRVGWKLRVEVRPHGEDVIADYLAARLTR